MPSPISHISDTARWVAMYRAFESERPDALFHDPYARRLAGADGERIVAAMGGKSWAWPMIVRTAVMDELILNAVKNGADTVLNLAAGLDARPWRLDLPSALRWIDVDFPAMQAVKREGMAGENPRCQLEWAPLDLADRAARRALFARAGAASRATLVIAEGLLVYLTPEHVHELAVDLHEPGSFRWWVIDLASPQLLAFLARRLGKTTAAGGAPMRFAPAEGTGFFASAGWREAEYRSMGEEAQRLHREMRLAWLWRFMGRFASPQKREQWKRFSGIVRLDRA